MSLSELHANPDLTSCPPGKTDSHGTTFSCLLTSYQRPVSSFFSLFLCWRYQDAVHHHPHVKDVPSHTRWCHPHWDYHLRKRMLSEYLESRQNNNKIRVYRIPAMIMLITLQISVSGVSVNICFLIKVVQNGQWAVTIIKTLIWMWMFCTFFTHPEQLTEYLTEINSCAPCLDIFFKWQDCDNQD